MLSKAWVCGCLTAAIAGSNPSEGMDVRLCVLWCAGSGLCGELITHSEKSCRVCAPACDLEASTIWGASQDLGCCATEKQNILLKIAYLTPEEISDCCTPFKF